MEHRLLGLVASAAFAFWLLSLGLYLYAENGQRLWTTQFVVMTVALLLSAIGWRQHERRPGLARAALSVGLLADLAFLGLLAYVTGIVS
jgi:hypothetical protein